MKEIKQFTFEYNINGKLINAIGYGTSQFEADRDAIINTMRNMKVKYDDIKFVKVISEQGTGKWI